MKIEIQERTDHYIIVYDNEFIKFQRKYTVAASDSSMNPDELLICAMCKYILELEEKCV